MQLRIRFHQDALKVFLCLLLMLSSKIRKGLIQILLFLPQSHSHIVFIQLLHVCPLNLAHA